MRVHITNAPQQPLAKGEFDFSFDLTLASSVEDPQFREALSVALNSFSRLLVSKDCPDPELY